MKIKFGTIFTATIGAAMFMIAKPKDKVEDTRGKKLPTELQVDSFKQSSLKNLHEVPLSAFRAQTGVAVDTAKAADTYEFVNNKSWHRVEKISVE